VNIFVFFFFLFRNSRFFSEWISVEIKKENIRYEIEANIFTAQNFPFVPPYFSLSLSYSYKSVWMHCYTFGLLDLYSILRRRNFRYISGDEKRTRTPTWQWIPPVHTVETGDRPMGSNCAYTSHYL
jgi:hypothetical protein